MKLLDWLFGINRDNAPLINTPLVSEQAKPASMRALPDYILYTRVTKVAYGLGGIRLDYAAWERGTNVRDPYWCRKCDKGFGVHKNATWKPAPCELDGFKYTTHEKFLELFNAYPSKRRHSVYEGKPIL